MGIKINKGLAERLAEQQIAGAVEEHPPATPASAPSDSDELLLVWLPFAARVPQGVETADLRQVPEGQRVVVRMQAVNPKNSRYARNVANRVIAQLNAVPQVDQQSAIEDVVHKALLMYGGDVSGA